MVILDIFHQVKIDSKRLLELAPKLRFRQIFCNKPSYHRYISGLKIELTADVILDEKGCCGVAGRYRGW